MTPLLVLMGAFVSFIGTSTGLSKKDFFKKSKITYINNKQEHKKQSEKPRQELHITADGTFIFVKN